MNCESCDDPKNSRMAAITGLAFTRSCGMAVDISWYTLIFSLMARSIRTRPMRNRSEEHTSELQSHSDLVCRLLLEKKKHNIHIFHALYQYFQYINNISQLHK